jgi:chromosome segregation ATPase
MTKTAKIDQSVTSLERNIEKCLKQIADKKAEKKNVSIQLKDSLAQDRDYSIALDNAKNAAKRKSVLKKSLLEDDKEISKLSEQLADVNEDIRIKKGVLSELLDKWTDKTGKYVYHERRIEKQLRLFN